MNIHEKYHVLAEQSLERGGVGSQAYLVKAISEWILKEQREERGERVDKVPESRVDEQIDSMSDKFVIYMNDKTEENLLDFLTTSKAMLSEVFHDCDTPNKRRLCKKVFDEISKI